MVGHERECSLSESTKQQKRKGDYNIKKSYLKLEENWKIIPVRHSPYCRSLDNMMRN